MEKRYYVAYGSNLNVRQMLMRCPEARRIGTSVIQDYRLMFKGSKTGSYLTIEPEAGYEVPVGIWSVTDADEAALDRYEGYPHFYYTKMKNQIICAVLNAEMTITDRRYIGHEDDTGYHHYAIDVAKQYEMEE